MLTRISNVRAISADSSVSSNDVRKIIFPTSSLANSGGGTITFTFTGDGSGFTNLNAGNLASGTVADARLSSNVPLKNTSNTFTAAQYITGTGGFNVGSATAPKGTGVAGSKLEIMGTGTGTSAFGSLAISRADSTGGSVVGSIDFYTITTLAAQILCNQIGGGAGGTNYLSFNLGAGGTMVTPFQMQYASGSTTGTLLLGAKNATVQGKVQIYSYANAANSVAIQLANPTSLGGTSSTSILWNNVDGANEYSIGQIRVNGSVADGVGDMVFSVGQGTTNGLQDFVKFANTGYVNFYGLSSIQNRLQSSIRTTWANSTDATLLGRMIIAVASDNAGTLQNAIQIDAGNPPTITFVGGLTIGASGLVWSGYYGFTCTANTAKNVFGQNQEVVTGSGLCNTNLHYTNSSFSIGYVNRNTYTHWFAGGAAHANFGTIPVIGNPAIYARVRMDPELMSAAATQTITLGATLYIGSAPANATNLTITTPRALHVNSGESYFGGSFIIGTGNIHFNGGTPIARPTAGLVTAGYTAGSSTAVTIDGKFTGNTGSTAYTIADIVAALKSLGLLTA